MPWFYVSEHCRNPDDADDLLRLRDEHPDTIVVKQLDITHYEKSFKEFVQDIKVGENYVPFKFYISSYTSGLAAHHVISWPRMPHQQRGDGKPDRIDRREAAHDDGHVQRQRRRSPNAHQGIGCQVR